MKHLNTYITEYIIKKKLDEPIDSEDHYIYFPKTKSELIEIIKNLLNDNQTNLNIIDVSKITDMSELFDKINQSIEISNIDISRWDVSNVNEMDCMFKGCENFDCDLSNWDVSNVTTMIEMFYYCKKFTGKGLENWNVSKVKNTDDMFDNCIKLKKNPSWYIK